ncbi:hypothetical protein [Paenibacillus harenae]|uniref:DUF4309 domain-containing protein n=1 Tax=Paenibacillus harenae TaxID=306543 RepID=A0ABT9TZJ6_PAEHA|nr:hypothetical protein [Paenibacillus harenae]MDQ0112743.1 hypothetical protein [Paenibacillus harenae]
MRTPRRDRPAFAKAAAAAVFALVIAGCQNQAEPTAPPVAEIAEQQPFQENNNANSPQKTYLEDEHKQAPSEEPSLSGAGTESNIPGETSALHNDEPDKAVVNTESEDQPWATSNPKLVGIGIGDSADEMTRLFGEPIDSYSLEEDADAVTVNEYDGFAVGINESRSVQYIEVYSDQISAGLSGLAIGDKPDAAIRQLGKPSTQTEYLLTYEAEGALLKIDLDPAQNSIVSIKLLTATDN